MASVGRRGVLAGVAGLVVGGVAGYFLRQPEVRQAVSTITQTVTRNVTETRTQTDIRTTTQTTTITAGARNPLTKEKIVIASSSDTFSFKVLQQQHSAATLREMGYNVEFNLLGVRGSTAAFASKNAQILIASAQEIATLLEQGLDIIIVGGMDSIGYYMVASSEINSLKDFEGKTFGISSLGAISYVIPVFMMRNAGVDTEKVQWVAVGGTGARAQAILAGRISGALLHADVALNTVEQSGGKLKLLATVSDIVPGRIIDQELIAVFRDWADNNTTVLLDLLRSKLMSDAWAALNGEQFVRMAAEGAFGKVDEEGLQFYWSVYDLYRSKGYLPFFTDVKGLSISFKLAKETGTITRDIEVSNVYEPKYYNQVVKNLMQYVPKA